MRTSLAILIVVASASGQGAAPMSDVMARLATGLRGIEKALDAKDAAAAAQPARDIATAAGALGADGTPLAATARALAEHASRGELGRTADGLWQLRRSCVACHVRTREETAHEIAFPGRHATLSGRVAVRTRRGEVKTDGSGVVVFLEGGPEADHPLPLVRPTVSQKRRQFTPRTLAVLVGTTVDFPNDDTVFHNVFSLSKTCCFDLDIYKPGLSKSVRFEKTGLVKVYCNIHPKMSCDILVLENSWFAVTDRDGRFVIPEVPDGTWMLRTWNALGAHSKRKISIADRSPLVVTLEIGETKKTLRHKNKFGRPYRKKKYQ